MNQLEEIPELRILRSNRFILYVALVTIIGLMPNTFWVYFSLSEFRPIWKELWSGLIALIVAGSIAIYTLRKNRKVAMRWAYFEMLVSAYYYASTIGWDWGLIPALGFVIMLPYSVSKYTEEIDVKIEYDSPAESQEMTEAQKLEKFMNENPDKKPSEWPELMKRGK